MEHEQGTSKEILIPTKIIVRGDNIDKLEELLELVRQATGFVPKKKDLHEQIFAIGINELYFKYTHQEHHI